MIIGDAAAVGLGAVAGALCRYQIGNIFSRKIAEDPKRLSHLTGWHTAGINICGSLILGAIAGLPSAIPSPKKEIGTQGVISEYFTQRVRLMASVGFCGSFTTFSTFSVDVVGMLSKGEMARAFSYVAVNNVGGILAAFAGFKVAKKIIK